MIMKWLPVHFFILVAALVLLSAESVPAADLRTDADAAPLKSGQGATLAVEEGIFQPLEIGATLFSNRGYTLYSLSDALAGMQFLFSSIDRTSATCLKPGRVYVLSPGKDWNSDSAEGELLAQGFEKTSTKEFFLFTTQGQTRFPNACFIYQKQVQIGEKIRFGKWGVLVCPATTLKAPPGVVRVACIGDSITFGVGSRIAVKTAIRRSLPRCLEKSTGSRILDPAGPHC